MKKTIQQSKNDNGGGLGAPWAVYTCALESMVELNPIEADLLGRIVQQTADGTSPWAAWITFRTQQKAKGRRSEGGTVYAKARRGSVAGGKLGSG